jgi:hypothetical protein
MIIVLTESFFDMLSYKNAIECHLLKIFMTILLTAATGGLGMECFTERISEVIYMCVCVFLLHYLVFLQVGMNTSLPVWQVE